MSKLIDSQVNLKDSKITISIKKAPLLIRLSFALIVFLLGVIPIAVTVFALKYGDGPHIGILFSFILSWSVGFYLLKVTLWNWIGREVLTLKPRSIHYIADYGFFKDGRQEIKTSNLVTSIVFNPKSSQSLGTLVLRNTNESLGTTIDLPLKELRELKSFIENQYNNTLGFNSK